MKLNADTCLDFLGDVGPKGSPYCNSKTVLLLKPFSRSKTREFQFGFENTIDANCLIQLN